MVRSSILLVALAAVCSVSAVKCDIENLCPEDTPCCSQYGECGVGAYCLGGCDPRASNSLESCVPEPVCKDKTYTFTSMDGIDAKDTFLGDSEKTDWVMDGKAVIFKDTALLTMAPSTVGTVLATSTYLWYGNVKARFKTSRGKGVVTAFILLSDVKDEIDYEFVGVDLTTAQSNYYHLGITNYENMEEIQLTNTFDNYHDYEIQWTPDSITWLVDGQVGRTVKKSDTWNATSNQWAFPQTPARVQISLWPGGLKTNGKGTIDWAGGEIDWVNAPDIKTSGYYYAQFESVQVECFSAKTAPGTNLHTSYTYNNVAGTNDTVVDGSKGTILKSLLGTGTNMTASSGSSDPSSSEIAQVPGLTGAGPGTDSHAGDSTESGTDSSGDSSSATDTAAVPTGTGFQQGTSTNTNKNSGSRVGGEGRSSLAGSAFAGIVAVGVLMLL
jgi:beta-glucanase (GH16 family)